MLICVGRGALVPAPGHVHRIVVHQRLCRRRVQTSQFLVDCHKPKEGMTLPIRVTWTAPMPTSAGMKRKTIYVLADEDRVIRYLGSTDLACEERFKLHKLQALKDGTASPLYRHVNTNGGFDEWTIQPLCVVDYNPTLLPNAARHQEDVCMKALRRAGHPLLNKNCAVDANERRRLANKRWRDAHPGYMAQKSREARQRRRIALETEGDAN